MCVFLSVCCRPQVCGCSSNSREWQPRRWQNLSVLQRERYGWGACWESHTCSYWTALQSTHTDINTYPCKYTLTQAGSHKGKFRHTQKARDKDTHTDIIHEIASATEKKTLDGCLSGFYNGRFQGLLSVIIFSLEKSELCCVWYNCPQRQKPERNVKCHQNLRGKDAVNGSTVILMPGFGTDWVCYTLQRQGVVMLNHWPRIRFPVPNPILIHLAGIHQADCRAVTGVQPQPSI